MRSTRRSRPARFTVNFGMVRARGAGGVSLSAETTAGGYRVDILEPDGKGRHLLARH